VVGDAAARGVRPGAAHWQCNVCTLRRMPPERHV
jgi:hypothetical protein